MELAIVDLESHLSEDFGRETVASVREITGLQGESFGIHDDLGRLLEADRIFVTGSADMVDDVAWAPIVAQQVAAAAQEGIPTLAVCFGHQLMARHYGSELRSFDEVRKGVHPIMFHGGGPFPPGPVRLIHTHRDYVATPGKMQIVAAGGFGGIAALKHPEWPLWTCQGHPEWNAALCRLDDAPEWQEYDDAFLDAAGTEVLARFTRLVR